MNRLLLGTSFVALWAGCSLLLSCLPWFQQKKPLADRLRPYVADDTAWVDDIERWLSER